MLVDHTTITITPCQVHIVTVFCSLWKILCASCTTIDFPLIVHCFVAHRDSLALVPESLSTAVTYKHTHPKSGEQKNTSS
jgi:hypothetical protein